MTVALGRLEVETPDHVVLRYTLAGAGSRGFAAIVDFAIATIITLGLEVFVGAVGPSRSQFLFGVTQIVVLTLAWSYFIVLEWLWNGQTIGKRMFRLRVINEDGSPSGFVASFTRNVLRVVDFLPSGYCVGLVAIVLSPTSQRLGDLAAKTYVVRAPRPQLDWSSLRTLRVAPDGAAAGVPSVRSLSGEAQRLVREFAARQASLAPADRARLAARIAASLRPRVTGIDAPDDIAFLQHVAAALREAGERR